MSWDRAAGLGSMSVCLSVSRLLVGDRAAGWASCQSVCLRQQAAAVAGQGGWVGFMSAVCLSVRQWRPELFTFVFSVKNCIFYAFWSIVAFCRVPPLTDCHSDSFNQLSCPIRNHQSALERSTRPQPIKNNDDALLRNL